MEAGLGLSVLTTGSLDAVTANRLFDLHHYQSAFTIAALCPVLGYGLWYVLNLEVQFDEHEDERQGALGAA